MRDKALRGGGATPKQVAETYKFAEKTICHSEERSDVRIQSNQINCSGLSRGLTTSHNDGKRKVAFTLAETMIVLVVLGVIATLTVPALIQKHIESTNRTKIKKAMTVYDTALNKMVIENGIKDNAALYENANSFAPEGNCTNTAPYFKVEATLNDNICTFKASDGVYWDISKINAPILAFKEADLNNEDAQNRFQLVGHFDNNGSLRVNDLQYETNMANEEEKENLEKIYGFINTSNNLKNDEVAAKTICARNCAFEKMKNNWDKPCENRNGDQYSCTNCYSCTIISNSYRYVYDENGNKIGWARNCSGSAIESCNQGTTISYDEKNRIIKETYCYSGFGTTCNNSGTYTYDYVDTANSGYKSLRRSCSYFNNGGSQGEKSCLNRENGYYDFIQEYNAKNQLTKSKSYCNENEECQSCDANNGGSCEEVRCENNYSSDNPSIVAYQTCYYK